MDTDKDIKKALLIRDQTKENAVFFHGCDRVYKGTNENIKSMPYQDALRSKDTILSVIGSGDQILNSILLDVKHIDAFDISIFTKYYLKLKIAAVNTLNYFDYLEFFYGEHPFDFKKFENIVNNLDYDSKAFWNALTKDKEPNEVYDSKIFTKWCPTVKSAKFRNLYLDNMFRYYELRDKLDKPNINYVDGDIYKISKKLDKEYDFVNLSNIGMYATCNPDFIITGEQPFMQFKNFVKNLKIRENGIVLNYIINVDRNDSVILSDYVLNDDEFTNYYVDGDLYDRKDSVNIYRKVR